MFRGFLMVVLAASLLVGSLILFVAFQLHLIQSAAQVEAQSLTLSTLIEKGAGDNAHVTLSKFLFARPIVEKEDGRQTIWLPMYDASPGVRHPVRPRVMLCLQTDEAAVPDVMKAATVTAIVANRMPGGGLWDVRLPAQFDERYPTEDAPETLVLSEPTMHLAGWSFGPGQVFAASTQQGAWIIGAILALVGLGGLLWMGRNEAEAEAASPAVRSTSLETEPTVSSHAFNTWDFTRRGFKIMLFCGIMLVGLGLLFFTGLYLLSKAPDTGYTIMAASAGLMLINIWLLHLHFQYRSHGVACIDVCNSGLRWLKSAGQTMHMASWSEIVRCDLNHVSPFPWRHYLILRFRSGEELRLAAFSLKDYHVFAKLVQDGYREGLTSLGNLAQIGGTVKLTTKLSRQNN